jgi:hypothetical protein
MASKEVGSTGFAPAQRPWLPLAYPQVIGTLSCGGQVVVPRGSASAAEGAVVWRPERMPGEQEDRANGRKFAGGSFEQGLSPGPSFAQAIPQRMVMVDA